MAAAANVILEMTPEVREMYDEVVGFLNPIAETSLSLHECVARHGWNSDICIPHCQDWDRAIDALKKRRAELSKPE